ncbi:hypothetical protein A0H76_1202 [Hepatospora eriocheir]|uniref:Uncharacterized protein n=1 Tax=Hepatospora eriocheir TaxID=1081669 RepID=A0A1X0QHH2_9MICR|nr:hypothetical protein A0H76_1202 [Hepatospora eriocheir]
MYYLFDQQLISSDNIINSFEILMVLVNKSQRRAALFYNEDDEIMLLTYFFQKMKRVIDLTMINSEDKIHSIQDLSHIYLLTKKFLGKKLFIVNEFLENLSNVSKLVFNDVLESINRSIRQQSINIYFTKPDSHKTLLNYVKSKIKIGEVFQGQNYNIFADKILYFLHDALKTQIFTIVFEKDQSDNLIRCIDEIVGHVIFMNRTNMSYYFNYLKNIILLISWPYDQFLDKYKELENVIYDRDLRSLIKCRKDKEKIKNLIVKNIK